MANVAPHFSVGLPIASATKQKLRVLIVDDDPIYRETSKMFLTMYGREVIVAENGTAGVRQAQTNAFDIMIVDMEMPDMTGLEVIGHVRKMPQHAYLPIIMVTSRDDAMAIDRAFELGASSFVVKPVNWTLLDHYVRFVHRASQNEAKAREAQASAEEVARTKDNLLNVLRHEMKTPLNAIVGFSRLAGEARENGDVGAMLEHLDIVSQSGQRLLKSFGDMALFSDLISSRYTQSPEDSQVDWLIEDALAANGKALAASNLTIEKTIPETPIRLHVDATLLSQTLARLIENVLTHASEAKTLTLRAERLDASRCAITIGDDGEGMDPEAAKACLEPFTQGDMSLSRASQGLGLGLPIVNAVMTVLNGSLTLTTRGGAGFSARLELPCKAP